MLSRDERGLIARVLRTAREEPPHWERDTYPGTYRTRDGRMSITWDGVGGMLQVRTKERRAWDDVLTAWPKTVNEALDLLAALELVPVIHSTAYERGWYIGRALYALERHGIRPSCATRSG